MQKHDVKKAAGTSGTQTPNKKQGSDSDLDNKKPMQKPNSDRVTKSDDDFNSPQRNK